MIIFFHARHKTVVSVKGPVSVVVITMGCAMVDYVSTTAIAVVKLH